MNTNDIFLKCHGKLTEWNCMTQCSCNEGQYIRFIIHDIESWQNMS